MIPSEAYSHLGPLPVEFEDLSEEDGGLFGKIEFMPSRKIVLEQDQSEEQAARTFWHECTHLALTDAGVANLLKPCLEEAICDAMGTYLAAAMKAGHITFKKD